MTSRKRPPSSPPRLRHPRRCRRAVRPSSPYAHAVRPPHARTAYARAIESGCAIGLHGTCRFQDTPPSATSRFQESKCADSRILFRTFQFPSFRVSYFRSCPHSFDSLFIHMRCQARQLAQIFNSSTLLSISTADRTHARTGPDTDTQRASLLGE